VTYAAKLAMESVKIFGASCDVRHAVDCAVVEALAHAVDCIDQLTARGVVERDSALQCQEVIRELYELPTRTEKPR